MKFVTVKVVFETRTWYVSRPLAFF